MRLKKRQKIFEMLSGTQPTIAGFENGGMNHKPRNATACKLQTACRYQENGDLGHFQQ